MSPFSARIFALLGLALLFATAGPASSHESRPFLVEISQTTPTGGQLTWKIPPSVPVMNLPQIVLPEGCGIMNEDGRTLHPDDFQGSRLFQCEQGLQGSDFTFAYPVFNPSMSTMVKFRDLDGKQQVYLMGPQENVWTLPQASTASAVMSQYTRLGIDHIWKGWDHLLFLVCLLWIAGDLRRIMITVTGFTLAHSVTLALSALQVIRIPIPPVEAAVALSIVFLAREILVDRHDTLTWRHPVAVSASFGLLHGLGFAAVLGEIGLPQDQVLTGLLFFNLGVEIGQLVFVAGVAALYGSVLMVARQVSAMPLRGKGLLAAIRLPAAYAIGLVSCYWLIDRVHGFI